MSRLRANQITNENANGAPNFPHGLTVTGVVTSTTVNANVNGDLTITDSIVHDGDTNTKIRFPAADTIAFETSGSERLRVTSGGHIFPGADSTNDLGTTGTRFRNAYVDTYYGDGSNLTGIDATKIQTGNTKVETTTSRIDNKIDNVGVLTVTASGAKVTGIVTVFGQGIDYQWQGGTATAWWKSEDLVSESSWPAAKGGTDANFVTGNGGSNGISYTASDPRFNNHKTVHMSSGGSGSLRTTNENQNQWWNNNDAFTMIMALQKDAHHSGTSYGDSAFAINYQVHTSGSNVGGWSFCPFGDHTWGNQYGEMFGYTGSQFEGQFMMFSYPFRGLLMVRMGANFDYGELSVNSGNGWHPLEMRHTGPSSLPSNNFRSLSILNNACENSSSHNFEGRVAECAWWKGKRLGGAELEAVTRHWCEKFQL